MRSIFLLIFIVFAVSVSCKKITPSIKDIDGNNYTTKKIGNQIWMTENLKVKRYRNGDTIPQVQNANEWMVLTTGAWCYFENDPSKGVIYNWHALNDSRGLAPEGFHIPNKLEIDEIINHLDGYTGNSGKKMKSKSGWFENGNGTNSSGFNGTPIGYRSAWGSFINTGYEACWWASDSSGTDYAYHLLLQAQSDGAIIKITDKELGFGIRCIKD